MTSTTAADLAAHLLDLAILLAAPDPLDRARSETAVLGLLRDHVPGVASVSVTRGPAHRPVTVASSDALAARADRIQYESGAGPCLHALAHDEMVVVDLTGGSDDERWPAFRRRMTAEAGIGGVRSHPLRDGSPGSLNIYLGVPGPDPDLVATAAAAARLALFAVATRARADQLSDALATSRTIGAAIGMLMARHGWSRDAAFTALREASQHTNRKLRDVAADVVADRVDAGPG
ncbi:ANTAR domain-containing protein [Pseudonocardia sp. N23]|uniref:ANTAR domain-containing protein n=1 Tax=Pseudonocardia sp. N23 TaxID=1987376 RepID=UPI000BFC7A2D|nr:ANTAR domain-containing protein [Pseudonocardia sp. N23]GAY08040.1 hypothetical protein TOK_6233 [Pseudonocardia sp. N23]